MTGSPVGRECDLDTIARPIGHPQANFTAEFTADLIPGFDASPWLAPLELFKPCQLCGPRQRFDPDRPPFDRPPLDPHST
ncbi:hypothetical protein AMR42_03460 [Limnothrix sp. PR1529]|nr:hypothetical protein AMR42_03460 [Limnothrix sp. PR1529]